LGAVQKKCEVSSSVVVEAEGGFIPVVQKRYEEYTRKSGYIWVSAAYFHRSRSSIKHETRTQHRSVRGLVLPLQSFTFIAVGSLKYPERPTCEEDVCNAVIEAARFIVHLYSYLSRSHS
jgi:hypothetical protein